MTDYEPALISVYAAHDVSEVRSNPVIIEATFGNSAEELARDPQFVRQREFVETQKRYIEEKRARLEVPYPCTQLGECLKVLLRPALFPDSLRAVFEHRMRTLEKLLSAMYSSNWSESQRKHFSYMVTNLIEWRSYFLSYTNRGAATTNERYKKVIKRKPKVWKGRRDWYEDNILADMIVDSLFTLNVQRSFYDKEKIGPGEKLMQKIRPAIDSVFAFIQLVQAETFTQAEDNYAYLEWKLFQDVSAERLVGRAYFQDIFQNRFAPILAPDKQSLFPDPIPECYDQWRNLVFEETRYTPLPTDPEKFDAVMKLLKARIVSLQEEILAAVPS